MSLVLKKSGGIFTKLFFKTYEKLVFVPGSLIYCTVAAYLHSEETLGYFTLSRPLALPVSLGWKGPLGTNTNLFVSYKEKSL
jgi:hypothetical protein